MTSTSPATSRQQLTAGCTTSPQQIEQGSHRPQTPPQFCLLGSYLKRPKTSPCVRWHATGIHCAQVTPKPKAACAVHFSWAPPKEDPRPNHGNMHGKNLLRTGRVVRKIRSRTDKHTQTQTRRHTDKDRHAHPRSHIGGGVINGVRALQRRIEEGSLDDRRNEQNWTTVQFS